MKRIFVSSVQKEFAAERASLADYLRNDPLQRRFFEPFLFEELPAKDQTTGTAYLSQPHGSYPANPLIAEPLYLAQYIERMGTGIGDMIDRCTAHGLQEPAFKLTDGFVTIIWRKPELALSHVTPERQQVAQQVTQLLAVVRGDMTRAELMAAVGLKDRVGFTRSYLDPALTEAWLEMTQPDSPRSPTQKYRLTPKGQQLIRSKKT